MNVMTFVRGGDPAGADGAAELASKQDLLREAVRAAIEPGTRILAESQGSDLDQILRALAAGAVDNRHLGVLW